MTRIVCLTVVVLTTVASGGVAAQERLTLARAVEASLAHNASLRAARAGADEATAHRTEARFGFFPHLSFTEPQPPREQSPSSMQDMMKQHEQMMAEMKAADTKLDTLVKEIALRVTKPKSTPLRPLSRSSFVSTGPCTSGWAKCISR